MMMNSIKTLAYFAWVYCINFYITIVFAALYILIAAILVIILGVVFPLIGEITNNSITASLSPSSSILKYLYEAVYFLLGLALFGYVGLKAFNLVLCKNYKGYQLVIPGKEGYSKMIFLKYFFLPQAIISIIVLNSFLSNLMIWPISFVALYTLHNQKKIYLMKLNEKQQESK